MRLGRQRFNVLGAWNAVTRHLIAVTNTTVVNTETMSELLRKIAALGLTGAITLVLDNARYQHNAAVKALASQLGITLLFLPSYSPNLNLIERLWKFTKRRALYGRYHPKFANFQAAIQEILDGIPTTYAQQLETLMTLNFQQFERCFTNGRVRYSVFQAQPRESVASSSTCFLHNLASVQRFTLAGGLGLCDRQQIVGGKWPGCASVRPVRGLTSARLGRSESPRGDDRESAAHDSWAGETIVQDRDCP